MKPNDDMSTVSYKIEGHYVNYFKVGYNRDVFVIDHYQYFPENPEEETEGLMPTDPKLRLIASPADARQLLEHLKVSIENYEKAHGKI